MLKRGDKTMLRDDIADQLVYATTRITATNGIYSWAGTGFFMGNERKIALVTNRHVVKDATAIIVHLVSSNPDGSPNNKKHYDLQINNVQPMCEYHPEDNIDVCLVNIKEYLDGVIAKGNTIYYKYISTEMIVTSGGLNTLTPIEDVIMIGYPNAIMDEVNCKPVVRSGITATDLKNDYNGKPEFMIDIACFPGSSGSPVFLHKQGLAKETGEKGVTLAIMPSYAFLGILYAGPTISVDGRIIVKDIPTTVTPIPEMSTMMNLGYVIKAKKILELY